MGKCFVIFFTLQGGASARRTSVTRSRSAPVGVAHFGICFSGRHFGAAHFGICFSGRRFGAAHFGDPLPKHSRQRAGVPEGVSRPSMRNSTWRKRYSCSVPSS